jgi:hypothetical protein
LFDASHNFVGRTVHSVTIHWSPLLIRFVLFQGGRPDQSSCGV